MVGGLSLNIASALIKQIIEFQDFETWSFLRKEYLPTEYAKLFELIEKHCSEYHELPTFEDLKFEIRDIGTKEKVYAIEVVEVEAEPTTLLEYLKNEYAQKEILDELEDYVENSVAFENAEESLGHLHQIILDVENRVEIQNDQESMQRINLFESEEEYSRYLSLGLNDEFDLLHQFAPRDLILVGGFRGTGKSLTCDNIAVNMFEAGKSSVTYSTEMHPRAILRRRCAMATGVDATRLRSRNLSVIEWELVASWWASRFSNGGEALIEYKEHRDFDKFHKNLVSKYVLLPDQQMDVVYDPTITIAKIHADLDKKVKSGLDLGIVLVDYLNKVKLSAAPSKRGAFDWVEQQEIAAALKGIAATFEVPVFAPFQTKEDGTVSFSKNMLNEADAAYVLKAYKGEHPCMAFDCIKMRDAEERDFVSYMNWSSLKIGPESAIRPEDLVETDEAENEGCDESPFR